MATAHDKHSPSEAVSPEQETSTPRTDTDNPRSTDSLVTVQLSDTNSATELVQSPENNLPSVPTVVDVDGRVGQDEHDMGEPVVVQTTLVASGEEEEGPQEAWGSESLSAAKGMWPSLEGSGDPEVSGDSTTGTDSSEDGNDVDWDELERNEEQEPRDEGSDESTTFLLARLEQENNALATDPKAGLSRNINEPLASSRRQSRPPSIHHLRKLVNDPASSSLRYSLLPSPPPMTELEFYAALVADFPRTAQCLPTLLSRKIRAGVPPPLRGVVWVSMAGARDRTLEEQYDKLSGEPSPYENLIGKDIGRSFPGVEMFRDSNGEGQQMLGRVLKCFSLYDQKIGYCQGLGFLVGPLLMHMGEKEAFCVLVRLMENYGLRSCFLPDLSGLHLRIYQFQQLLAQHLPGLSSHLEGLQIEAAYVSQWFLSFFAVSCPLPMLFRIYDVILAEGASETLMRVALSLMRRNEAKILALTEFEDVMQLLLSRVMWDVYNCDADHLVNDFVGLTGVVTHEGLQNLETAFRQAQSEDANAKIGSLPDLQAVASRFLGRLWAGSSSSTKSVTLSPGLAAPTRPSSFLRRSPSKQSIASTLNSNEGGSEASMSTVPTETSNMSRQPSTDCVSSRLTAGSTSTPPTASQRSGSKDKDLHGQIEDLLTALSEMQRDQALTMSELQREKEDREEDRKVVSALTSRLKQRVPLKTVPEEDKLDSSSDPDTRAEGDADGIEHLLNSVDQRFSARPDSRRSSILETKHQLRDELRRSKEQCSVETSRTQELTRQLAEGESEAAQIKEQLKEARVRIQEGHRDKQRLEKVVQELRSCRPSQPSIEGVPETATSQSTEADDARSSVHGGLREFKLNRTGPVFSKRTSSLNVLSVPVTETPPSNEDALLVELVNSKTAEANAKQEAEELRAKLESLRKMIGGSPANPSGSTGHRPSPSQLTIEKSATLSTYGSQAGSEPAREQQTARVSRSPASAPATGGFWGVWGKRSASTASPTES